MTVQEPNAESNKSYGDGPRSWPPTFSGSSACNPCLPFTVTSVRKGDFAVESISEVTTTSDDARRKGVATSKLNDVRATFLASLPVDALFKVDKISRYMATLLDCGTTNQTSPGESEGGW
eukprot:CAMPEP_0117066028 /NCGR_PEP_ID=MMETSP0472-20121206/46191_1 /TAXON_ID=693140 ORGANISM="Tiarina fusus, Strain LIS" /NCGR_SAMPLE_ID=MMETSP0472 /ASSEMBLY_ACC=CAM_ASM_000603 /LENGTH=119 /DNA_ID=CAMNT_0004786953 /DNA_START=300 /DNA_END=656 /DNA_ORIENTATION=-